MGGACMALHRQGNHWHIGVREHVAQRNPGAMIESALRIGFNLKALGLQGLNHCVRHLRATDGWVAQVVQGGGKTVEVVDGFGLRRQAHGGQRGFPVGADYHNGARCCQLLCDLAHGCARSTGVQGKHGRSMGYKKHVAQGRWGGVGRHGRTVGL